MKKYILMSAFALLSSIVYAEERLVKDIDGDGKKDVIWLEDSALHIKLSSQNNRVMRDIHEPLGDEPPFLHDKRVGFELSFSAMRWGHRYHYAYDKASHNINIIGYNLWAFGNASNDGSGDDSVNLKTGDYIGQWNYLYLDGNQHKLRTYRIPKTRLPNIRPIAWDDPKRNQKLKLMRQTINQVKKQYKMPIDDHIAQ